ncbi:MAG: polyphosphate kinase [Bacteroidetes bacterium]|nr:MAG: polyphosphate kinase [Bacteroidota bacterium]
MSLLKQHDPDGPDKWNREEKEAQTLEQVRQIGEYVKKLYAESKRSILLILQGMDASGKDGLTRELFSQVSPSWVQVHSFKKPTEEEFAHDFLWRVHQKVPRKGMVTVFNRSHYEDILVPSVYGYIDKKVIEKRYRQINDFEEMLEENGTRILKFYLNISKEDQFENLTDRINVKRKHWKHSDGDWDTRDHWDEFMEVYERIFEKCDKVPWHIIPCDRNWTKEYVASKILLETLEKMDPKYPDLESERFEADYSKSKD